LHPSSVNIEKVGSIEKMHAYVITLEERAANVATIQKELGPFGVEVEMFPAVDCRKTHVLEQWLPKASYLTRF
jgi:hypothetical protein